MSLRSLDTDSELNQHRLLGVTMKAFQVSHHFLAMAVGSFLGIAEATATAPRTGDGLNTSPQMISVKGDDAKELSALIPGEFVSPYKGNAILEKSMLSRAGTLLIICRRSTNFAGQVDENTTTCTVQRSSDGKKLKIEPPKRVLG